MTSITRATEKDHKQIIAIGRPAVTEAHRESCSPKDLEDYVSRNYNDEEIKKELNEQNNIYHLIYHDGIAAGFSKIVLNEKHQNISAEHVTKLDRIYLLKEFYGLKLGAELLNFNIEYAKNKKQSAVWLFTWTGNKRAIDFYLKAGFEIIGSHNFRVTETHYNPNHQMMLDLDE